MSIALFTTELCLRANKKGHKERPVCKCTKLHVVYQDGWPGFMLAHTITQGLEHSLPGAAGMLFGESVFRPNLGTNSTPHGTFMLSVKNKFLTTKILPGKYKVPCLLCSMSYFPPPIHQPLLVDDIHRSSRIIGDDPLSHPPTRRPTWRGPSGWQRSTGRT